MNMPFPSREQVEFIRKNYPPGTRVMLNNMNDPYSPVEPGTRGTVRYVDDSGQLGVAWDNGRSLSLIPGEDSFRELTQQEIAQEQGMKMGGDGAVSIRLISTEQLRRMGDQEGLVLQGCGGDPQEWVDGINEILAQEGILKKGAGFEEAYTFRHDGLTCMLFPFKENMELDMGKLAIWRLASYSTFGGTWLSDYVPNRLGGFIQEQKTAPERIKGTIEFRMFNSTLHAGEVKSYIQLCLAISHQALVQQRAMRTRTHSENEKYTFRTWLLRLGLIGDEFKTARQHLLKNLEGNIAWKDPAQAERQRERLMQQRLEQGHASASNTIQEARQEIMMEYG